MQILVRINLIKKGVITISDSTPIIEGKNKANTTRSEGYPIFIMTVGVGGGVTSASAVETLKGLASTVDGKPAYFHVEDYSKIKNYVDQVFNPLCEQFHSACGLDCKGFCGWNRSGQ